ncbi:alpha/beta hydrolase [Amaricoccus sp.]|uniref:alpha/beta fold hydrolase n=1 Tax=Amaricoccus sp. TaxID=1872485 RepID=UPI00260F924C|nr:alpha/beta hydrolase [Amaricoccus sp.]HRO11208.1 alpha/beta hydrolase [Amaricoccus sp.]
MTRFARDGIALAYEDAGTGPPALFQHGLGGDARQSADVFPTDRRRITLECRGQGGSDTGPEAALSIATFAADLESLARHLALGALAVGGISMGAAIALRLAVRHPGRVGALVLARPAWVAAPAPANMRPYAEAGALIATLPPAEARRRFAASATAATLAREAPDNLASLLGFFGRPPAFGRLLQAIAADGPGVTEAEIARITVPTLVIGHGRDLAHPLAHAERLAALIPGARLRTITPKATDRAVYAAEFRAALADFLP